MSQFSWPLVDPAAAAALASAERTARRWLVSRRMFRSSVTAHTVVAETYERVLYTVERRRVVRQASPGGSGVLRPPPIAEHVDPWGVNPDTIEDTTSVVTGCGPCGGRGQVDCSACRGSTWMSCPHCIGGRVFAQRKGKLFKNCAHCRGRGTQKCTHCHGGKVSCPPCGATGRMTVWLALERKVRTPVAVHPRNAAARLHPGIDEPADFDAGVWPTRLSADTGVQPNLAVPQELTISTNAREERIVGARRQTFGTDVHQFTFTTPVGGGRIDVAGEPPRVSPASRWGGLRTRLIVSAIVAGAAIAGVRGLYGSYVARHAWYAQYGDGASLVGFGVIGACLLGLALACCLVTRAARSWFAVGVCGGATAAFALGVILACTYDHPDLGVARRALADGQLVRAHDEAWALFDLRRDPAGGGAVLDALHLRKLREATSVATLAAGIAEPWYASGPRGEGEALLRARVHDDAVAMYRQHDVDGLAKLIDLGAAVPDATAQVRWLLAVVRGGAALEAGNTDTALAELDLVGKLADPFPVGMPLAETADIAAAAAKLAPSLAATKAKAVSDQVKALAAVVGPARDFAKMIGMDAGKVGEELTRQQRTAWQVMMRAERWAQQQRAKATAAAPIDPYTAAAANP